MRSQTPTRPLRLHPAAAIVAVTAALALAGCGSDDAEQPLGTTAMTLRQKAVNLLKSIETGDPEPLAYVGAYKQHNLSIPDGRAGLEAVLDQIPEGSAKV